MDDELWLSDLELSLDLGRELRDRSEAWAHETSRRADRLKFRGFVRKIRDMAREHPPGWGAWGVALIIPMLVMYPITGQSSPQPVQPNVIQQSGDSLIPDPELLRALVGELSLQQRVELASGKLSLPEVELAMEKLSRQERLGLAREGLSDLELYEFMQLFVDINGLY